jgi:hypothetical protein
MIDDMQIYIANLGKYNEGELVGDWFSFRLRAMGALSQVKVLNMPR